MAFRLASPLLALSLLSALCPTSARAETAPLATTMLPAASMSPVSSSASSSSAVPAAAAPPPYRFGVEGGLGTGVWLQYASAGVRGEVALSSQTYALARLSYLHINILDGAAKGGVGSASLGFRHYAGSLYAGIDAGARFELDDWEASELVRGSIGIKSGPVDLGLEISGPLLTAGITIGVDVMALGAPSSRR